VTFVSAAVDQVRPVGSALESILPGLTADARPNPWFSWTYVVKHLDDLTVAGKEHVLLTVVPVLAALVLAFPLALAARRWRRLEAPLLGFAGALYTIPALALIAALWPVFGLSLKTVAIALTMYALLIVLRNLIEGLDGVDDDVRDAARGMGYGSVRMLFSVELPLALPTVMAGVRVATVSTIGLVTIGSVVGHGGFGQLILNGFQANFYHAEIMTGVLACIGLAVIAEVFLVALQRLLTPWTWRGARRA
jgi:osmoprotectant transport system permease protein